MEHLDSPCLRGHLKRLTTDYLACNSILCTFLKYFRQYGAIRIQVVSRFNGFGFCLQLQKR